MKKDPIFTGAAVAIITPMHEDVFFLVLRCDLL